MIFLGIPTLKTATPLAIGGWRLEFKQPKPARDRFSMCAVVPRSDSPAVHSCRLVRQELAPGR